MVDKKANSRIAALPKRKFLVPKNLSVGQFYFIVRKGIQLSPEMALFFFVENTIPAASLTMGQLYEV